ncbi:extracellular matrix organizing protein FRAS1-like [Babylonia areolata]|uniref:extracellular matrix organizing protein FRAS1-like n=1 Tax=Babylonia areolata TaxID=304850 RepID=UPI003FD11D63
MASTSLPVLSLWLVLCVHFLPMTAHAGYIFDGNRFTKIDIATLLANVKPLTLATARSSSSTCSRGDMLVRLGTEWRERCRQCTCTDKGTQCTGPRCAIPYKSTQEFTCAKWADDCCCAEEGCMLPNGTTVAVGGAMPFDPARPCHRCTCRGGNRTRCLMQSCWPLKCVDGVRVKGQCCPACPNGRTCFLPFEESQTLSQAEIRFLSPVREYSPVTLRAGAPDEVTCTCTADSIVAKCNRVAFPERARPKELTIVA